MALIDEVVIRVIGGSGGNGCISFRREKYIPKGGPDGGNGGRGGSVYLQATRDKTSLLDFKYQPKFEGDRGAHGKGSDMDGRGGDDRIIGVPVGTLVYNNETGELLYDLIQHGQTVEVAKGGRGGRGNRTFVSSILRAPRIATPGHNGETFELKLELQLVADVGLIGLPNAGKSSFLRVVSRATPKVADYPFTTLEPCLGVVDHKGHTFVMADLPGLIEGASEGAGLGHKFLRHVSRNRVLLHLIDVSAPIDDIVKNVETVRSEIEAYDPALLEREERVVFTKVDLLSAEALEEKKSELEAAGFTGASYISSHTKFGVDDLLTSLVRLTTIPEVEDNASLPSPLPPMGSPEHPIHI
jgi:GTP-binding protein